MKIPMDGSSGHLIIVALTKIPDIEYSFVGPVGGIYVPIDKLSVLTPYLALVGLIGAISSIFAIRRW